MKITLPDRELDVRFFYYDDHEKIEAKVEDLTHGLVGYGTAIKSKKDDYNKKVGRKVALLRALRSVWSHETDLIQRELRTNTWNKLFERMRRI